jgi:hypothetical protein
MVPQHSVKYSKQNNIQYDNTQFKNTEYLTEEHVLDTYAGKQLSSAATDV